uniref:Uncharacterized protein n=1 Tax=Sphaerodactylus townsendi TaxID=933632 RepID=A0ACB8EX46_9SAUR
MVSQSIWLGSLCADWTGACSARLRSTGAGDARNQRWELNQRLQLLVTRITPAQLHVLKSLCVKQAAEQEISSYLWIKSWNTGSSSLQGICSLLPALFSSPNTLLAWAEPTDTDGATVRMTGGQILLIEVF